MGGAVVGAGVGAGCRVRGVRLQVPASLRGRRDPTVAIGALSGETLGTLGACSLAAYSVVGPGLLAGAVDRGVALVGGRTFQESEFEVKRKIGEGSFGAVYEGTMVRGNRGVILKRIKVEVADAEGIGEAELRLVERLERTVKGVGTKYLGTFVSGGAGARKVRWLVWENVGDLTLADFWEPGAGAYPANVEVLVLGDEAGGGVTFPGGGDPAGRSALVAKAVMVQLLEKLESIHATGLTHRDVKPEHLLLTEGGLRLIDWGAALDFRMGEAHFREDGLLDPTYCPPERLAHATDEYTAPPEIAQDLLTPLLWQVNLPDRFDTHCAGVVMLQLCFPHLRGVQKLGTFIKDVQNNHEGDLEQWRAASNSGRGAGMLTLKSFEEGFSILDADGGHGWKLLCGLMHPGRRQRLSAAAALSSPWLDDGRRFRDGPKRASKNVLPFGARGKSDGPSSRNSTSVAAMQSSAKPPVVAKPPRRGGAEVALVTTPSSPAAGAAGTSQGEGSWVDSLFEVLKGREAAEDEQDEEADSSDGSPGWAAGPFASIQREAPGGRERRKTKSLTRSGAEVRLATPRKLQAMGLRALAGVMGVPEDRYIIERVEPRGTLEAKGAAGGAPADARRAGKGKGTGGEHAPGDASIRAGFLGGLLGTSKSEAARVPEAPAGAAAPSAAASTGVEAASEKSADAFWRDEDAKPTRRAGTVKDAVVVLRTERDEAFKRLKKMEAEMLAMADSTRAAVEEALEVAKESEELARSGGGAVTALDTKIDGRLAEYEAMLQRYVSERDEAFAEIKSVKDTLSALQEQLTTIAKEKESYLEDAAVLAMERDSALSSVRVLQAKVGRLEDAGKVAKSFTVKMGKVIKQRRASKGMADRKVEEASSREDLEKFPIRLLKEYLSATGSMPANASRFRKADWVKIVESEVAARRTQASASSAGGNFFNFDEDEFDEEVDGVPC